MSRLSIVICILSVVVSSVSAFEVGQLDTTYLDPSRNRSIGVSVFYPSDTAGSSVPVADGSFPVIVFGHGYLIGTTSYQFLSNGLVPEGYIVALAATEGGLFPSHSEFGRDLAFLCDHFQNLNTDPSSLFYTHVAETSAIMGHSMGGGASFLSIQYSDSVTALVNLAAAETNPSAISAASTITIPALMFSGTKDCVTPPSDHQIPMYNALASDCKTHVTITGASHCQFAQNNSICRLGESGAACTATIPLETQENHVIQYLIPWLDYMLKDDPASWTPFQNLLADGASAGEITFSQDCDIPEPTSTQTPECIHDGDANQDETLTAADAQLIFNFVLGSETPSYKQACAADCNADGSITAGDAQQTFNSVLGTDECADPLGTI